MDSGKRAPQGRWGLRTASRSRISRWTSAGLRPLQNAFSVCCSPSVRLSRSSSPTGVIRQRTCRRSPGQRQRTMSFLRSSRPRDAGRGLDHPGGDFQRGKPRFAGAPQDPEHVELLIRDPPRRERLPDEPPEGVRGAEEADGRLLSGRLEGARLADLCGDAADGRDRDAANGRACGRLAAAHSTQPRAATRQTSTTLPSRTAWTRSWRLETTHA